MVFPITHKSKVLDCFSKCRGFAENHTSESLKFLHVHAFLDMKDPVENDEILLKAFRSDNRREHLSAAFKNFMNEQGIQNQLFVAHASQQIGAAEKMSLTLLSLVRSLLHHKSFPKHFGDVALSMALYVLRRVNYSSSPKQNASHQLYIM